MSVHNLTSQNFQVVGAQGSQTLKLNYSGNVLVLFKLQQCQGCSALEPIFYQLSNEDKRVGYAVCDLTHDKNVITMSRNTTTAITKVPHLILYVQGAPHARFKGESKTIAAIKNFISSALQAQRPAPIQQYQTPQQAQPQQYAQTRQQQPAFVTQQPGQNMYGGQAGGPAHMPEVNIPRQANNIAGANPRAQAHPSMQQQCDPENESCLLSPPDIFPYNIPWEIDYKKLEQTVLNGSS